MALSIDWLTKIITVPKADLTLIQSSPTEIRELNLNTFRFWLKGLEESEAGMTFLDTHRHNTEVLLGGLTFARVIEMINGYTVTFEDGQYAVNLVGANSNVGDVVNVNQVSVRSYNSAGLISSPAIEYASYQNRVTIDVVNGVAGTLHPTGTPEQPVSNLADAKLIAEYRGFTTFFILGNLTLGATDDVDTFLIKGGSANKVTITCVDGCSTLNTEFQDVRVTGDLGAGNKTFVDCFLEDCNRIEGKAKRCMFFGTNSVDGSDEVHFIDCYSGVAGPSTPILNMNDVTCDVALRNYVGGLKITNASQGQKASFDLHSGHIQFDTTVTNIDAVCRGIMKITDNSVLSAGEINIDYAVNPAQVANFVWNELLSNHTTDGSAGESIQKILDVEMGKWELVGNQMIFYKPDNVTEIFRVNLFNQAGTPSMSNIFKREYVP